MKRCSDFYKKNSRLIENIIFPLILFIWPLLRINQGLSMADTMYALSNYEFFPQITGPWMQATYLANLLGYIFMKLPGGGTVIGMYLYTGLVLSAIMLITYYALRKTLTAPLTAAGELIASCMCWCPTLLLYNYLTYMLMTLGIIFLWKAIKCSSEAMQGRSSRYFIAAGFCLGLNVMSRMANAAEAVFIAALWLSPLFMKKCAGSTDEIHAAAIDKSTVTEKSAAADSSAAVTNSFIRIVKQTLLCIAGWAAGFLIPLAAICMQYGPKAYGSMINSMFSMTDQATDYKLSSMLSGMFGDYGRGILWLLPMAVCAAAIVLVCVFIGKRNEKAAHVAEIILSVCGVILWIRFCWGRGMFNYDYYEYRAIYYWAVIFLILALVSTIYTIIDKKAESGIRLLAFLILIEILLTSFGSNNQLYPIINNMFLVIPFTLERLTGFIRSVCRDHAHTWAVPVSCSVCAIIFMTVIQSIGFYFGFALQDGVWGDPRLSQTASSEKTAGIYTTSANAGQIDELCDYADGAGIKGRDVIDYGDIPGVGYLLDMSPALSSFWPSLPSYQYNEWEKDIAAVEKCMAASDMAASDKAASDKAASGTTEDNADMPDTGDDKPSAQDQRSLRPVIITSSGVGAYLDDDDEGMKIFSVDPESMEKDEKLKDLHRFMKMYGYKETFCNGQFVVYE